MALSQSIEALLAVAARTSAVDDVALEVLARRLLTDVSSDPETPDHLKEQLARRLRDTTDLPPGNRYGWISIELTTPRPVRHSMPKRVRAREHWFCLRQARPLDVIYPRRGRLSFSTRPSGTLNAIS